jgi:hypothetical protein
VKPQFKIFPGVFKSWEETCEKAAAFVEEVGPERLITVAHTADPSVVVWYWPTEPPERAAQSRQRGR